MSLTTGRSTSVSEDKLEAEGTGLWVKIEPLHLTSLPPVLTPPSPSAGVGSAVASSEDRRRAVPSPDLRQGACELPAFLFHTGPLGTGSPRVARCQSLLHAYCETPPCPHLGLGVLLRRTQGFV